MRSIQHLLADDFGLDLRGWRLIQARAVSANGLTIVGNASNPDFQIEAWIATLPQPGTLHVDIKPGTCPNWLNRRSRTNLPVALLGREDADGSAIDWTTIQLARGDGVGGIVVPLEGPQEPHSVVERVAANPCDCHDPTDDGILDLSMSFDTADIVETFQLNDSEPGVIVELILSGNFMDGTPFFARDFISLASPADLDTDGDVDGIDFTFFAACFNKAGNPPRGGCSPDQIAAFDFDNDNDVDGADFAKFAACFNGANNPPGTLGCPQN